VGPFILGKTLGEGATGKVKLGFHKDTGFKAAVKIIKKEMLLARPSLHKKVQREIAILKLIDHPFVLKLYDVYETSRYLFIVMEYVEGGELFEYLVSKGSLDLHEALRLFQMLIHGLDYIHSQHVCHRDLKPENLLLDNDKRLKIADLGMSAIMQKGKLLSTSCGSPHYASPEVVMGKEYDGRQADVWSCGVILFALVSGKLPFDDENIRVLLRKVKEGVFAMPPFLHRDVRDLISKMLVVDPTKRITVQGVKQHPWFISNHNPLVTAPCSVLDDTCEPIVGELDADICSTLEALGIASRTDLEEQLRASAPSQARIFYRILLYQKEHPPSDIYERVTRVQGRMRASTFAYDENQKKQLQALAQQQQQQQQQQPPFPLGHVSLTVSQPTVVVNPARLGVIAPSMQGTAGALPQPERGRERSCSVGPKTCVVNLPHVYVDATGPFPRPPSRTATPTISSPLRGVALPQIPDAQPVDPEIAAVAAAAAAVTAAAAACASTVLTEDAGLPTERRRRKSVSGRAVSASSQQQQQQGSPPTSPLMGRHFLVGSDVEEGSPVRASHSPARRTFWASIFRHSAKTPPPPPAAATGVAPSVTPPKRPTDLAVHSNKPLADIQRELQRCFDSLGIEWRPHEAGFKARFSSLEGAATCHFGVSISRVKKLDAVSHFVEFKFEKGDSDIYSDMCTVLEKSVRL